MMKLTNANVYRDKQPTETELNSALAFVSAVGPENELEAALAVQMSATHDMAMIMLQRTMRAGSVEAVNAYGNLATKLQRTFTAQIEALAKLRRNGEQTVRVEHVHVYPGGQAIVGNVTHGGGSNSESDQQSYGPDVAATVGPALLGQDTLGNGMPLPSFERQETVSAARRSSRCS